jgi:hypothetical protein
MNEFFSYFLKDNEIPLNEVVDIVDRFPNFYSFSVLEECSHIEYGCTWRPSVNRDHVSDSSRTAQENNAHFSQLTFFTIANAIDRY